MTIECFHGIGQLAAARAAAPLRSIFTEEPIEGIPPDVGGIEPLDQLGEPAHMIEIWMADDEKVDRLLAQVA